MKKQRILFALFLSLFSLSSCTAQLKLPKSLEDAADILKGGDKLSNQDVIAGLKEALSVGTNNATGIASKVNGYYKNPQIKIPFPPEAQKVESTVRNLGMGRQVDDFIETLNRAAEEAAKEAAPIFLNAVKQMTIQDGWAILKGSKHEATDFLNSKTSDQLYARFKPVVKKAIDKVQVTKYWNPIITKYNKIPMVQKQNPDIEDYTTRKAIEGLFHLVAKEEEKIRENPGARVTDMLRKVFAQQD